MRQSVLPFVGTMLIDHRAFLRLSGVSGLFLASALAQSTVSYTITTIAGNGTSGYTGDAGAATSAELSLPFSAVLSSNGNLYIADQSNQRIRFVGTDGKITTAAGNGTNGYTGDGAAAGSAALSTPSGVAVDSSGNLYIADTGNSVIRKVTSDGKISTYAGNVTSGAGFRGDGGAASSASLYHPSGVAVDSSGNLYIADTTNNAIRKVTASSGIITTVAGNTQPGYSGDNAAATRAQLKNPVAVALDASGNLYIADSGNHVIRKVAPSGIITTVAGNGTAGFSGDGNKAFPLAQLNNPKGVAVDNCGNVYISDTNNSRIRMVSSTGVMSSIAGTGGYAYTGDGGAALSAQLNFPAGVSLDAAGKIYVSDSSNHVVRLLTPVGGGSCGLPSITANGVVTASSFGGSGAVAPGAWIEIYGSNLAANTRSWATADFTNNGQNAPVSLDRTSVTIANQQAYVDYISPGQVNVLIPFVNQGTQQLTVTSAAGNSAVYNLTIDPTKFGVFAPPQFLIGGKQYLGAVLTDGSTFIMPANSVTGITSRPAHPGETITIYGVGFGPVDSGTLPGIVAPAASSLTGDLQILFGTTPAVITYKGLAPQAFGLYQFNVVVPAVPSDTLIPVTVKLNGVTGSQTLYTAVQ